MRFNYNKVLREKLYDLQNELGLSQFNFEVDSEQAFLKQKDLEPNTIYVLTRNLQNDNSIGVDTQPVQILVLSEQNSLDIAKALFSEFAKRYNFEAISETYTEDDETHNIWVKQQYSDPVVLSNFNTVDFGYRSVLYISATLYIMYDVVDISNLEINSESLKALNFNISYSMTPNTQQLPSEFIASSKKTTSTFAVSMSVPMIKGDFVTDVLRIIQEDEDHIDSEDQEYNGNNNFWISFDFSVGEDDSDKIHISKKMKMISAQIVTAPNQVPGLQIGFIK